MVSGSAAGQTEEVIADQKRCVLVAEVRNLGLDSASVPPLRCGTVSSISV